MKQNFGMGNVSFLCSWNIDFSESPWLYVRFHVVLITMEDSTDKNIVIPRKSIVSNSAVCLPQHHMDHLSTSDISFRRKNGRKISQILNALHDISHGLSHEHHMGYVR